MRTTASGSAILSNLIESLKAQNEQYGAQKPTKQSKKYHIDLGQDVSRLCFHNRFFFLFREAPTKQKIPTETPSWICSLHKVLFSMNPTKLDRLPSRKQ
jgi:hypothetical protein